MTDVDLETLRRKFAEKYGGQKKKRWSNSRSSKADGYNFSSQLEAAVYSTLKLLERDGQYKNVRCQVVIPIAGKLTLKVDFVVFDVKRGVDVAIEAKGKVFGRFHAITQAWHKTAPMDLIIYGGNAKRPVIVKTIRGKNDLSSL